jgi:hypothetical protein
MRFRHDQHPLDNKRISLPRSWLLKSWCWWRLIHKTGNNVAAITDYSKRWDHGEIISTAFAESTVDLVISRRFAKKQQMQWSKKGAHRLLQTRTRTLDGTLRDLFTTWYPAMPANDVQPTPSAAAA